jgi:hypothetical protein
MAREDSLSRSEWQDLELTNTGWHTQLSGPAWMENVLRARWADLH